jgi:hypothetical protein
MNKEIARALLTNVLGEYRGLTYAQLTALVGRHEVRALKGPDGREYQIEVQTEWDDQPAGPVRVLAAIDDGGLRAFVPLCDDFLMRPDGNLTGEP